MGSQTLLAVACIVTSLAAQAVSAQMSLDKLNQGIPRWFHSAIPLQLWQTCPNGDLTASAHEHIQTWRDLNPELEMHLHNDTAAEHFVKAWFSEKVYKTYMEFPLPVMRADFWRYAIVFVRGGFYADLDTRCLRPIHNWLELESPDDLPKQVELSNWRHCRMIIGLENPAHFCQWAFAAARGHPILGKVLENIMNKAFLGIDTAHKHFVHLHTGPGVFTESIMDMLGLPTNTRVLDAWKMVYTDNQVMQRANELGLCVFHEPFFRNRTLINSYASQSHEGTWSFPSWQKIQANIAEQEWAKRHPEEAAKQKSSGSS